VLALGRHDDHLNRQIQHAADDYAVIAIDSMAASRRQIVDLAPDVLIYTDIGLEPVSYSLAFARLAPVQCVTWAHPVTTGIPTIDYFISCACFETAASPDHYTERLVRLKDPAVYYYRPVPRSPGNARVQIGLPESGALYVCPHSLAAIHPEFDHVMADILRRDERGHLILLEACHHRWTALLQQRFLTSMPDVLERVHFLPLHDHGDIVNILAQADVLLDPIYFGDGCTSYEGLSQGTPMVTMPGALMRSRITLGLYRQMEVMDCVANTPAEYVDLAVKLGTDQEYRTTIRGKIRAASEVLFENAAGVREFGEFLLQAVG
jgi:predicted O-linked N-acetylglucosamine transferase (SPINDLY family)